MNTFFKSTTTLTVIALTCGLFFVADYAQAAPRVTLEKAQEIAVDHAKVPFKEVTFIKASFDNDFKDSEYDIEFFHNNVEYEYEIDADTGKVKSYSQEKHGAMQQNQSGKFQSGNYISKEQAKQAAFKHANINSASFARVEFDIDDGMAIYEVEFFADNNEYEYEIDAISGKIIKFEMD